MRRNRHTRPARLIPLPVLFVVLFASVLVVGGVAYTLFIKEKGPVLRSFADCMAQEGSFVLETYPQKCVYKDQTFVDPGQNASSTGSADEGTQTFRVTPPSGWVEKKCAAGGVVENVFYAPRAEGLGACGSEKLGRFNFSYYPGDKVLPPENDEELYKTYNSTTVSINGVSATIITTISRASEFTPDGMKQIAYYVYKNGANYIAQYIQGPNEQDYQKEFQDTLATWSF